MIVGGETLDPRGEPARAALLRSVIDRIEIHRVAAARKPAPSAVCPLAATVVDGRSELGADDVELAPRCFR